MANRKILYGYQIIHGDLVIQEEERLTVQNIFTTYLAGLTSRPDECGQHPFLSGISAVE